MEQQKLVVEQESARMLSEAIANKESELGADYSKSLENALEKQKGEIEERLSIEDSGSVNFV